MSHPLPFLLSEASLAENGHRNPVCMEGVAVLVIILCIHPAAPIYYNHMIQQQWAVGLWR